MSNKRLDRREQRRAEAKVRQAAFDAEVRAYACGDVPEDVARRAIRAQHNARYQAVRP